MTLYSGTLSLLHLSEAELFVPIFHTFEAGMADPISSAK